MAAFQSRHKRHTVRLAGEVGNVALADTSARSAALPGAYRAIRVRGRSRGPIRRGAPVGVRRGDSRGAGVGRVSYRVTALGNS